jgi:basic membrane protein A
VTGFTFADALGEVSKLYPKQNYMIVDVDWVNQPNVMQFVFAEHQGSYLVGVAAALKAQADKIKNPKFGFIGGVPGATITKFEIGYIEGIKSVIPNATIVDYYANDWGKPELAKAQAKNWYDSGVYVIYSAAGGTGNGTIAQAKEYRSQGKNVWSIGVDSDQYEEGVYTDGKSAVLTSMLKSVETATLTALKAVEAKSFTAGVTVLDMKSNGINFSDKNTELGADIVAKVNAVKQDIIDGKVTVHATYKDALAAKAVPEGLGAKDN